MATEKDVPITPAANSQADAQTLQRPDAAKLHIPKISLDGEPLSQFTTRDDEEYERGSHPASPFYSHPTTKTSYEQLKSLSNTRLSSYEMDLEAQPPSPRPSQDVLRSARTNDSMWPRRETLVRQAKQRKKLRGCYPWNQLNRRQKLISKVLIILLVIGIGVIIGVTVSMAVGGTWYRSANQQSQVGQPTK